MIKSATLFAFVLWTCCGHASAQGTYCGKTPSEILSCLHNPKIFTPVECSEANSECDKITCIFQKSGWFDGDKVNKLKVTQHFNNFAKDYPDWSPAVQHLKTACLTLDLKPQGIYTNCPAYDIIHCVLISFFRNAKPSQWSTSENCQYSRQYAAACPVCPGDCFAPSVPYGTCNACMSLPRSP